jgi:hypothetical protein
MAQMPSLADDLKGFIANLPFGLLGGHGGYDTLTLVLSLRWSRTSCRWDAGFLAFTV